jgi:hypothetical protein
MAVLPPDYYNRFENFKSKKYKRNLYRAGKGLQSAELNEDHNFILDEIATIGTTIFTNGGILAGGDIIWNRDIHQAVLNNAKFFADGYSHDVDTKTFQIGIDETVRIGFGLRSVVISEIEDPIIRDPALNTRNYNEAGAYKLQYQARWCKETDLAGDETFFPVYSFVNGDLVSKNIEAPDVNLLYEALARYDRDSNGNYVVWGMEVSNDRKDTNRKVNIINVMPGLAHVWGYEVRYDYIHKFDVPYNLDQEFQNNEPTTFTADGWYQLRWNPIASVGEVNGTKNITETITRGVNPNTSDILPHTPVVQIIEVKQGTTVYTPGTDYVQNGDAIDWRLGGNEPAPGSLYTVTYDYQQILQNVQISEDRKSINVTGFKPNTTFYVDYYYYIPRIDRLILKRDGSLELLTGVANRLRPAVPKMKETTGLQLAQLYLLYDQAPVITMDYYRAYRMSDIQHIFEVLDNVDYNVAMLSLRDDARSFESSTDKKNLFVDAFLDDRLRDMGIEQDAIITDKTLYPYVDFESNQIQVFNSANTIKIPWENVDYINQYNITDTTRINDVTMLDIVTPFIRLNRRVHRWIDWHVHKHILRYNLFSEIFRDSEHYKPKIITPTQIIDVSAKGFMANERVLIEFDGKPIKEVIASSDGSLETDLEVPRQFFEGTKLIKMIGQTSGIVGIITYEDHHLVVEINRAYSQTWGEPIAEVFLTDDDMFLTGVDLYFVNKPDTYVDVYLTETKDGYPDRRRVLQKVRLYPEDITDALNAIILKHTFTNLSLNGWNNILVKGSMDIDVPGWGMTFTSFYIPHSPAVEISEGTTEVTLQFDIKAFALEPSDYISVEWYNGDSWQSVGSVQFSELHNTDSIPVLFHKQIVLNTSQFGRGNNFLRFQVITDHPSAYKEVWISNITISSNIQQPKQWTHVYFDEPTFVAGGEQYAILLESPDINARVGIARLGEYDSMNNQIYSTPDTKLVQFLKSRDRTGWYKLPKQHLTFQLKKARFIGDDGHGTYILNMGDYEATGISDALILTGSDNHPYTKVEFILTFVDRNNEQYSLLPYKILTFPTYTGTINIQVKLATTNMNYSPFIDSEIVLCLGVLSSPSEYVSRAFEINGNDMKAYVDVKEDINTSVKVYYQDTNGNWAEMTRNETYYVGKSDGYVERQYIVNGIQDISQTRIKVSLNSTNSFYRCYAQNLRVYVI